MFIPPRNNSWIQEVKIKEKERTRYVRLNHPKLNEQLQQGKGKKKQFPTNKNSAQIHNKEKLHLIE